MFTSISKLRDSTAMESRVDKLERWLKNQVPSHTADMIFPIAVIAISNNDADDFHWVQRVTSTHVRTGYINGKEIDLDKIKSDVAGYNIATKANRIAGVEVAVAKMLGSAWSWKDGIWPTAEASLTPRDNTSVGVVTKAPSTAPEAIGIKPTATIAISKGSKVKTTPKKTEPKTKVKTPKVAKTTVKPETFKVDRTGSGNKTTAPITTVLGVPLPESASEHAQRKFKKALFEELSKSQALLGVNGAEVVSTKKGQVTVFTIVV